MSFSLPKITKNAGDLAYLRRLKRVATGAEVAGRTLMVFVPGLPGWFAGMGLLSFHLSLEAQLNHSIMHGAFVGLPGVGRYTPDRYETLANPFRSATWRDAHFIHHGNPSLLGEDPDTIHPIHPFVGVFLTFEFWAYDYDRFLKSKGVRRRRDRGELVKFASYLGYQFGLFALLAGARWPQVIAATFLAIVIRNFVFTGLQTASSVGHFVSTSHPVGPAPADGVLEKLKFQVETSKNYVIRSPFWRALVGGLDRHIEHHLYPSLPPNRLREASAPLHELCRENGIRYVEFPSFLASLRDSVSFLARPSHRARGA